MSNRPVNPISFIKNIPTKPEEISKNLQALNANAMWSNPFMNRDLGYIAPPAEFLFDGLLAYADGVNWSPGNGKGFYRYNLSTTTWVFIGNGEAWDDLVVPLTTTRQGALSKPDFDYTNIGFLFPQNDATEILYLIVQMPHTWKEGTTIYPHVHWQQAANQNVTWKMDYKWFNIGSAVPAGFTTYTISTLVNTYVSGNLHQISKNATGIDGTGLTISSLLLVKLYRDDNVYTGDAMAFQFDIHYLKDTIGSRTEYAK